MVFDESGKKNVNMMIENIGTKERTMVCNVMCSCSIHRYSNQNLKEVNVLAEFI